MPLGSNLERANFFLRRLYFYRDCRTFIVLWQISDAAGSDQKQHQRGNDRLRRKDALLLGYAGTHLLRVHNSNFTGSPSSGILEL